ncbi:MAG: coniferyl aldehyde dehydrogenase [Colwellia sp.]|nr:coniferyl aldehyde dehydrogenase [Colwellia sp.]
MASLISDISLLPSLLKAQQEDFTSSPYTKYQSRINDLTHLKKVLIDNKQAFAQAISQDFGHRCKDDTYIGDILTTVNNINYTIKQLRGWMKPHKRHVGILFQPASAFVHYQPLGVVGIVVPWNYPLFLSLGPLTTVIAAGNRAMLKMSEFTPATNELLARLLQEIFTNQQVAVIGGEADIAAAFSALKFDHLFFTGSTAIGRMVLKAAAQNMVPVTLELGGKSPAIIDADMPISDAVSRMILGKTLNSGQTCVAPDYIFCPHNKIAELVEEFKVVFKAMFPTIKGNPDYTSIINDRQYTRLTGLLVDAQNKGATIIRLGEQDEQQRKIPLTLFLNVTEDMAIMQQEIFGPFLPIISYHDISEAINYVNAHPHPLASYVYSYNKHFQQKIIEHTHAGGMCINDAAFHVANDDLPFGGLGESGMGSYHGIEGFKTFSHAKGVFKRGKVSFAKLLFPPYGKKFQKLIYKLFIR